MLLHYTEAHTTGAHTNSAYQLNQRQNQTWRAICLGMCVLILSGCETLGYYSQAIVGHWQLNRDRQPLQQALTDERLSPTEQARLALIPQALGFAQHRLGLPTQDQYQSLVFMDRSAVTWNVFAAPPDSLTPKTWCFPIIGCISYRGYFSEEKAQRYASKLSSQGWETYIGGAAAYSTLGWFEDPVLNTFLKRQTPELIGLLFHELAHQQLYIRDDTTFNESFATTVEQAGVTAWYAVHPDPVELAGYQTRFALRSAFLSLALATKQQLEALYTRAPATSEFQQEKTAILANFRSAYEKQVTENWQGQRPYSGWMKGPLNNAQWSTLGAYYDLVPALTHLLNHLQQDFGRFYAVCEALGKLPKSERYHLLDHCTAQTCPLLAEHAPHEPV
jgi:predicted aminopeptidase